MRQRILKPAYIAVLCEQLVLMLQAGIPLSSGLEMLSEEERDAQERQCLRVLYEKTDRGEALFEAMESSGVFPSYAVQMVRLGETTGRLEEVLRALCTFYQRQDRMGKSLRNALLYPVVMVVMMVVVIGIILTKVLPVFEGVFEQMGAQLSGTAAMMLKAGDFISAYAGRVGCALLLIVGLLAFCSRRGWLQKINDFAGLYSRSRIYRKILSAHFASCLALTLASGLSAEEAVALSGEICTGRYIREKIEKIKQMLQQGQTFSDAIVQSGIFTGMDAGLIRVGIQAGSPEIAMQSVAEKNEESAFQMLEDWVAKIEPTIVIVMSVAVGAILLSVMLPLISALTSF